MGGKGSKGKSASAQSPKGGAGSAVKLQLPPKKVKKESPYDLQYFVFLGGQVVEEFVEVPRGAVVASPKDGLVPPKALSDMSAEERKAWDAEVEKHEKKLKMQNLMEKNLQQKLKHGDKPIEPPVAGGLMGKAKKKIQQAQEKVASKADELSKPIVTVEERVKKQAMAGAQGSLTGGATAALGQDIAKSQQMKDLEKKRKEFAKQEEDKKKKEEEERKKKEDAKKKNKPKGLNDFLQQVEGSDSSASAGNTGAAVTRVSTGAKLRAFLSSTESATDPAPSGQPIQGESAEDKANRLQAFLSASTESPGPTPSQEEGQPEPRNNLADFLGSSSQEAAPSSAGDATVAPVPADEQLEVAEVESKPDYDETVNLERPKSEAKRTSFLGAAMRRLSLRASVAATKEEEGVAASEVPNAQVDNIPIKSEDADPTGLAPSEPAEGEKKDEPVAPSEEAEVVEATMTE